MQSGKTVMLLVLGCACSLYASDHFDPEERRHWAFQKVGRPELPQVENRDWVRNGVDAFVLAELEKQNIPPGPPADKRTLLRRAYLDLIGMPPTPAEVSEFLNDTSAKAFERAVERLLSSPHYGERWARHWLDLARYAESEGFKADETRPNAWRYRDYVIRSFNSDKPYDRFLHEQIGQERPQLGDARPDVPEVGRTAGIFYRDHRVHAWRGGRDKEFHLQHRGGARLRSSLRRAWGAPPRAR